MTEEAIKNLKDKKRFDLVDIYYINQSGYAGNLPNGNIVDRREYPEAMVIPENSLFGVTAAKSLDHAYDSIPQDIFNATKIIRRQNTYTGVRLLSECTYFNTSNVKGVDIEINGIKTFLSVDKARDIDLESDMGSNQLVQSFISDSTKQNNG